MDSLVVAAKSRGIKILFIAWIVYGSKGPPDPVVYAGRVKTWAQHFALEPTVVGFEIWNEPDLNGFTPQQYGNLVKVTYDTVKAAVPSAVLVAGAFAPTGSTGTETFFDQAMAAGMAHKYDKLSYHPYSGPRMPSHPVSGYPDSAMVTLIPAMRRVQQKYGDSQPHWLTEWGVSTWSGRTGEDWQIGVDEKTQAAILVDGIKTLSSFSYVQASFIYEFQDDDGKDLHQSRFGVVRSDLSEKPGYQAAKNAILSLAISRAEVSSNATAHHHAGATTAVIVIVTVVAAFILIALIALVIVLRRRQSGLSAAMRWTALK